MSKLKAITFSIALASGTVAFAGGHDANPAVKARQAHMALYSFSMATLGDMAKGATEYNAETASAVASDLAALAALSQSGYWAPGTAQGEVPGSRAKAEIWTDGGGAMQKGMDMATAAAALAETAGGGLEALQAGMGSVGEACSACHKAYRGPRN